MWHLIGICPFCHRNNSKKKKMIYSAEIWFVCNRLVELSCSKDLKRNGLLHILQDNWSALMFAAKNGALEISIELLERGASLEHRDMVRAITN